MSIETVFSSKGRVKILRILVEIGELNISEIARRAKLNYTTTNQHLQVLETSGIVRHKNFGSTHIPLQQRKPQGKKHQRINRRMEQ
jgi:predicted transcriptional regulator